MSRKMPQDYSRKISGIAVHELQQFYYYFAYKYL